MVAHGRLESHFRNGRLTAYSSPGQVAAARGFAVFYPDYRGSTGRGMEFSMISQAAATGPEFDDLVDGVDHRIARGAGGSRQGRHHGRIDRSTPGSAHLSTRLSHRGHAPMPVMRPLRSRSATGCTIAGAGWRFGAS